LLGAAVAELSISARRSPRTAGERRGRLDFLAGDLGIQGMLLRAGLAGEVRAGTILLAKVASAVAAFLVAAMASAILPGRLGVLLPLGMVGFGFLVPDLVLARMARRRLTRIAIALPDALDLLAVSVGTGRQIGPAMADLGVRGRGPLADEFDLVAGQIEWGRPQEEALAELQTRLRTPGVIAFCRALERSRRLGSPLAEQLRRQAAELRHHHRREIQEEAARAAPKIQLVIAFILVPSVMLMLAAVLLANSEELFGVFSAAG
jgi:tight adherence protein C